MTNNPLVEIWTDGSCISNPGPAGWAAILKCGSREREILGKVPSATNNAMEITAAIRGLQALKKSSRVRLYTDSAYLAGAFGQNWIEGWKKRGWKNSQKEPVANRELWEELEAAIAPHDVEWVVVKGHSDDVMNNRAHDLAYAMAQAAKLGESA